MNRKIMVAAVAAAFAAPAAFAQSSVTVGGTVNILWDSVKATGATASGATSADLKSHDRVRDGNGSNIRFTVIEDLGGGNSAFVQVESAVIANSDTRTNAFLVGGAGGTWGNRNSGIGLRSKAMGRILMGVWDVHYDAHYSVDPGWIIANSGSSTLGLMNTFGSSFVGAPGAVVIGNRYSNVIRWDSPTWSGFSMAVSYARPSDGAPVNSGIGGAGAGDVREGKKNRVWSFSPQYRMGGLTVQYSYLQDKDINSVTAAGGLNPGLGALAGGVSTATWKITGNRLGVRYRFANGFGLGAIWDSSKISNNTIAAAQQVGIKRQVWAFPLTFETGNHHLYGTYSRARDWRGQIGGVGLGAVTNAAPIGGHAALSLNYGADTGASMWNVGYQYKLSQRTNLGVSYNRIRNDRAVAYDLFANSTGNTSVGADPRQLAFNLRHTF